MNVFSLFENAARAGNDRPAVRYGERRQTYGDFRMSPLRHSPAARGPSDWTPGDRVAIFLETGFFYPSALLGAFRGGFVAVPINVKLHPRKPTYIVENAEVRPSYLMRSL